MTVEDADKLVERMGTDEAFREKVLAAETADERVHLAAAEGYVVTQEEVASAAAALSDAGLQGVTGGAGDGDIYLSPGVFEVDDRAALTRVGNQNIYGRVEKP
jgi:predicted ribosomally synthesized peptide with nif11-like leader